MSIEEIRQKKRELRRLYKEKRRNIDGDEKKRLDEKICSNILNSVSYKYADVVLAFCPTEREVDIRAVTAAAKRDGKRVAFPRCESKGIMKFYFVDDEKDLKAGSYGIYEPIEGSEPYSEEKAAHPVCIVPCLCADVDGKRLGYGGGYYDRFLSSFKGISLSTVYEEFIFVDIPFEKRYDRRTDIVVTEKGVRVVEK